MIKEKIKEKRTLENFIKESSFKEIYKDIPRTGKMRSNFRMAMLRDKSKMSRNRREVLLEIKNNHLGRFYSTEFLSINSTSMTLKAFMEFRWTSCYMETLETHLGISSKDMEKFHLVSYGAKEDLSKTIVAQRLQEQFDELVLIAQVFEEEDFASPDVIQLPSGFMYPYSSLRGFHKAVRNLPQ